MWTRIAFVVIIICVCEVSSEIPRLKRQQQQPDSSGDNFPIEFFNNCSCVLYYQCDEKGFIITSGEGIFDFRAGTEEEKNKKRVICNGGQYRGELVCCKHKPGEENKPPITDGRLPNSTTTTTTPIITKKRPILCGKPRPPAINVRIFAEDELTPIEGEFPWLAAIYKRDSTGTQWKHYKAGSLIHPKVVLTAYHVVGRSKASELKVIVNGQIVLSQIGDREIQERGVEEIVKHPQFSSGTLQNDVALLILQEPYNISTTPAVNTICLRPEVPYENKRCFVAGWGRTLNQNGSPEVLKKVELPTHSPDTCEEMLRKTRLGGRYVFHQSFMCAGGEEGKDACTGDGGSPLVCPSGANDTMYQVGIVAYGIGCGLKDVPGVYANIAHLHGWIVTQLKDRDINI